MTTGERDMIQPLDEAHAGKKEKPFTSLQPTYEDSVPPDPEQVWEGEEQWGS